MSNSGSNAPTVLIAGAGLGGLMLAILLEKANIPYYIFERASSIKPLGSVMSLNASILGLFEQLGMLDAVMAISKLHKEISLFDTNNHNLGSVGTQSCKSSLRTYNSIVFARPDFYCILLSKIPSDKIKLNKRVVHIENNQSEVVIRCADNSFYRGNIIVGADGAHSDVRQRLFQQLSSEHKLPSSDSEEIVNGYICIVGITDTQQLGKFPAMKDSKSHFRQTLDNDNSAWHVTTLPGNRLGWGISSHFTFGTNDERFQNSEWNPESNEVILKRFRDSPNNFGSTMGEVIDATPKSAISTVYLEEKLFETWYHERTVLIGDACHKMHPRSGQGAINAMQDAVVLSNCIYKLGGDTKLDSIQTAFQAYKNERYPYAKSDIAYSTFMSRIMSSQQWSDRLLRKMICQYLPTCVTASKTLSYRPQAVFLPAIERHGSDTIIHQKSNPIAV